MPRLEWNYLHGLCLHQSFDFLFAFLGAFPGLFEVLLDYLQILLLVVDALLVFFDAVVQLPDLIAYTSLTLMLLRLSSHCQAFLKIDQGCGNCCLFLLVLLRHFQVNVDEVFRYRLDHVGSFRLVVDFLSDPQRPFQDIDGFIRSVLLIEALPQPYHGHHFKLLVLIGPRQFHHPVVEVGARDEVSLVLICIGQGVVLIHRCLLIRLVVVGECLCLFKINSKIAQECVICFIEVTLLRASYNLTDVFCIAHNVGQALVGDVEHVNEGLYETFLQQLAGDAFHALDLLIVGADRGLTNTGLTLSLSLFSLFSVTFELCSDSSLRWATGGCAATICAFVGTLIGLNFFSLFWIMGFGT